MNLIRLIVLALVFWLVYRLVQRMLAAPRKKTISTSTATRPATEMVRCAHCGIHIPRGEALQRDGLDYCSEEHRKAGPVSR